MEHEDERCDDEPEASEDPRDTRARAMGAALADAINWRVGEAL